MEELDRISRFQQHRGALTAFAIKDPADRNVFFLLSQMSPILCAIFSLVGKSVPFTLKKNVLSRTPQKGSVDVKKLPDELKCRKKQ